MSDPFKSIKRLRPGFQKSMIANHAEIANIRLRPEGQTPQALFITCMDSCCSAEDTFGLKPGDAFEGRPMGDLIAPYDPKDSGCIQKNAKFAFAIKKGVKDIFIVPHTDCGVANALVSELKDPDISPWLEVGKPALEQAKSKVDSNDKTILQYETEQQIGIMNYRNILTYPAVQAALEENKINITTMLYDLIKGRVTVLDPRTEKYQKLDGFDVVEFMDRKEIPYLATNNLGELK